MTHTKFFIAAASAVLAAGALGVAVAQSVTPQPHAQAMQPPVPSAPAESAPASPGGSQDTGSSMSGSTATGAGTMSGDTAAKADRN
jgi:hypothetical protein